MPLVDRVLACSRHDPARFRPFAVAGETVGAVTHALARRLAAFPEVFETSAGSVALHPRLETVQARTRAVAGALEALRRTGDVGPDRGEPFPVVRAWGEAPRLLLDRSAVSLFGVRAFGVHVNGYVVEDGRLHVWVARRSRRVHVQPGHLDHVVAGGQPHGLGLEENLEKECREEASIPPRLARRAVLAATLSYRLDTERGLKRDTLFAYDLELPPAFVPRSADGEVERFERWPAAEVLDTLRREDVFKFNVGPVILDFLLRRGVLGSGDPEHGRVVRALDAFRRAV